MTDPGHITLLLHQVDTAPSGAIDDVARTLGTSPCSVERDRRFGRTWLMDEAEVVDLEDDDRRASTVHGGRS